MVIDSHLHVLKTKLKESCTGMRLASMGLSLKYDDRFLKDLPSSSRHPRPGLSRRS